MFLKHVGTERSRSVVWPISDAMLYSHNPTIQIYRCREIRNTGDSLFRHETFIYFLTLVFRHEERETHNFYYADCTIWPKKRAAHPVVLNISVGRDLQNSMVRLQLSIIEADKPTLSYNVHSQPPAGLVRLRVESQRLFQNYQIRWPSLLDMTSFTPQSISYLGFLLWHLWLSYPLRTSVNCTQCVCTCTKSRIVQSPTEPNDKI